MTETIEFRPAASDDFEFLFDLHKSTLGPHVDTVWGWADDYQRAYLRQALTVEDTQVVVIDGAARGRLAVEDRSDYVFIALIEIDPTFQDRCIGSRIMRTVLQGAFSQGKGVRLNVLEVNSGARRLYRRLGFTEIGRTEIVGAGSTVHFRIEMSAVNEECR